MISCTQASPSLTDLTDLDDVLNENPPGGNNSLILKPFGTNNAIIAGIEHDPHWWEIPTAKNKEYIKTEKDLRKKLFTEPSQFKVPDNLPYKVPTTVAFVLETQGAGSASAMLATIPGTASQDSLLVSTAVKAVLSGAKDNVKIELRDGDETKTITAAGLPTWTWDVTNLDGNDTSLTLSITTMVKGYDAPFFLKAMQALIPAHVTIWDWVVIHSSPIGAIWAGIMTVGGAAGTVLKFFGKGDNDDKDKPDKDPTPNAANAPAGA